MKTLVDYECMSGTGWVPEDYESLDCTNCGCEIDIDYGKRVVLCPECGVKLKIKHGVLRMIKLEMVDL